MLIGEQLPDRACRGEPPEILDIPAMPEGTCHVNQPAIPA